MTQLPCDNLTNHLSLDRLPAIANPNKTFRPFMSKTAILSDIHANLPAFTAVLREVEKSGAERIAFLGDIVGYGASPAECVKLVRNLGGNCVMGNHDEEIRAVRRRGCSFRDPDWRQCGYQAGLAHAAMALDADQAEWLAALPYKKKIDAAWIAHGSLDEPEAFDYIEDAESAAPTLAILQKESIKTCFVGHTHVPGVFVENDEVLEWPDETKVRIPSDHACVVSVGSVGQPRSQTDRRASWVLWDSETRIVEFRKTEFNRLQAANDIAMAGLPLESALRL
jgi:predicted phosphodiesterase